MCSFVRPPLSSNHSSYHSTVSGPWGVKEGLLSYIAHVRSLVGVAKHFLPCHAKLQRARSLVFASAVIYSMLRRIASGLDLSSEHSEQMAPCRFCCRIY